MNDSDNGTACGAPNAPPLVDESSDTGKVKADELDPQRRVIEEMVVKRFGRQRNGM